MSLKSVAILPVLFGASVASADTFTLPPSQLGLLPGAHMLHAQCHAPDWYKDPDCKAIRESEQAAGDAYAKANATDVFVYDQHKSGRRELYDQTKVKGSTSDAGFIAGAALKRYLPTTVAGASSQPEFDNTTKPLIDSCDEYVYKRFYSVNRYLDTLGGLLTARKYYDAVGVILNGIPSVIQAPGIQPKACAPLQNAQLADYDGKAIAPFSFFSERPAIETFAPKWTGSRPKNEFWALPTMLAPPQPGTFIDTFHSTSWWNDYTAAYNASQVNAFRNDGADGEFARARWARTDLIIRTLSPAEAEDIAARRMNMRRAMATVSNKYARCLMKRFRDVTATANLGPGTWKSLEQYVSDPQEGWTYPVDLDELSLAYDLTTSSKALSALSTTVSADLKSVYLSGAWARSRTGSLLRALNLIDSAALSTAVSGTASTIKSFNVTSECNLGEEFDAVRDLVVAEWRSPNHGCYSGSRCDFSDKIFANDIKERLQTIALQEDDVKHACTSTTSDDWVDGTATVDTSNRGSISIFEAYLKTRHAELQEILRNTPHNSTLANSIGDLRGGGSDWGNGTFGAGYSYRGEWAVNVSKKGTILNADKESVGCSVLGGRVDGQLNAYATGFGYRKNLIDAGLTAKTSQPNQPASLSAHANILGSDLFTPIENIALKPSYTDDDENTQSFTLATAYVAVGPFPVKVSVEVGFDWGYHMKFGYQQSECIQKPTLSVGGELAPYAGTNASVSAGIDLFIVGAGVKFTLTLVSASLPFDASVTVAQNGTDWTVTAESNLALDLTELAGKVSLYITTFGATVMEFELFSWPGLHQHFDLWHDKAVFPFAGFSLL